MSTFLLYNKYLMYIGGHNLKKNIYADDTMLMAYTERNPQKHVKVKEIRIKG